jgi:hypothetical protein
LKVIELPDDGETVQPTELVIVVIVTVVDPDASSAGVTKDATPPLTTRLALRPVEVVAPENIIKYRYVPFTRA